jgi:hypothetical protein
MIHNASDFAPFIETGSIVNYQGMSAHVVSDRIPQSQAGILIRDKGPIRRIRMANTGEEIMVLESELRQC